MTTWMGLELILLFLCFFSLDKSANEEEKVASMTRKNSKRFQSLKTLSCESI